MMKKIVCASILFLIAGLLYAEGPSLGNIDFPTSGKPEAQPAFLRGMLWLHSFEYPQAREAFREAQKLDPDFAMAYWGEALTHDHPLWRQQDLAAARAALQRLAPTPQARTAKAATPREKAYLQAVEALFGEGDATTRDRKYAEAMGGLKAQYPEDLEAATLYALALLGTSQDKRDYSTFMKAAAVAEEVFAKNPEHPGAAHYLIHSYDDPVHAPLGLRPARVYARIAPAAPHALHMPSHIFLALGMWDQVVASNVDSFDASDHHSNHAMYWLLYGYLQQGREDDARKLLLQLAASVQKTPDYAAGIHLAMMRATYIVEAQSHIADAASITVDTSGFKGTISASSTDLFATGYAHLKSGDLPTAEKVLRRMQEDVPRFIETVRKNPGIETWGPPENEIACSEIVLMQFHALILMKQGKQEQALQLVKQAAEKEDAMSFDYGPPIPVKPSRELYGELLLEAAKPVEAATQLELTLQRHPNRAHSVRSLQQARERTADH